jgi:isoleucyl-tRNA synthetase
MPAVTNKAPSIHMTAFPKVDPGLEDAVLAKKWTTLIDVRAEVTKALEAARADKVIGHSLDASVTIGLDDDLYPVMAEFKDDLRSILIVSRAAVVNGEIRDVYAGQETAGVWVKVEAAGGEKCQRCWVYKDSVGTIADHPTICSSCGSALTQMGDLDTVSS